MATFDDFLKLGVRVGRILEVEIFPEARRPTYKLKIDFGPEIGVKKSSAQLVKNYPNKEKLIGKIVLGVVNFSPKQIGPFVSEVLVLGVPDAEGECILIEPDSADGVPLGGRLY